ncbi:putative Zinc finger C2H2-type [Septoria linicola]|nr:putative Zinc finger C2H2-type [Septoria linicola]
MVTSPNQPAGCRSAPQITRERFSHATSNNSSHLQFATPSHTSGSRESPSRRELPVAHNNNSPARSGVIAQSSFRQTLPSQEHERLNVYNTAAALPHGVAANTSGTSLPQDGTFSIWASFPSDFTTNTSSSSWSLEENDLTGASGFQDLLRAQASPPHQRNQDPPTIRLTAAPSLAEPQADASFFSTSPLAGHDNYHIEDRSTLSRKMTPYMAQESVEAMQTPVSPVSAHNSPHDTTMGEPQQQLPRKRSHSVMSQQHDNIVTNAINSRAPSIHSQPGGVASPTEEFSPRGSRAFKRGDPPTNENNKYICTYAEECYGQTFDRKCEWSKHMDKHDRPYRCPHPSCAKLQGFTYSGGLLRHEREVHGKHGGPKAQLMCPFADCKRHSGKGFTRKENLNEHLRRVHQGKEAVSQQDPRLEQNGTEVAPGADDAETQATHASTTVGEELSQLEPSLKRQRTMTNQDHGSHSQSDEKDQVIAQLRADNAWYADRVRQLEAAAAMSAEKTQRLEETIALWAQHSGQNHIQHDQQQEYVEQPEQQQQYVPQQEEQPMQDQTMEEHQHLAQQQATEQQIAEHQLTEQQLAEPQLEEPQLAEAQLAGPQLAQQELSAEDTMEGDLKAALASVQAA